MNKTRDVSLEFKPDLTPAEMLRLGVFGGAYFIFEKDLKPDWIPASWWRGVRLSPDGKKHKEFNFFGVDASQSLAVWQKKGWINPIDPHGWFEWYCRYTLGRRVPEEDVRQIKRWIAMRRHVAQVSNACRLGDFSCHTKQRQALLHWAYDSRKL